MNLPADFKIAYRRINHVTIAVPRGGEKKVRSFYEGVLGLEEESQDASLKGHYKLIWYRFLDILIHCDFTPPYPKPAENHHIAVEVADLGKVRAFLESKGAEIREAVTMPDRDRFYLLDPFGTYFELIEMKRRE